MPDLMLGNYGWLGDLVLTSTGDLATVDGTALGVQRVTRRVLTPPAALVFHPDYGFGLPQKIGTVAPSFTLAGQLRAQMYLETVVSQVPPPSVTVAENPIGSGRQVANVAWVDAESGAPMLLSFDPSVGPPTTTP